MSRTDPDVSVVVVNFERPEMTRRCLDAVRAAVELADVSAETLIVDNGSTDDSVPTFEREASWARVVPIPVNGPLPAALNRGWESAAGRWVLMLNNDILLEPPALAEALDLAEAIPRLGTVALEMRFASAPGVINSAGIAVDQLGVPFDLGIGRPADARARAPVEVFGACGAAVLYRREMLEALGGFDESFGFGFEDVDLSWRAQMLGWKAYLAPAAVALHAHGGTVSTRSPFRAYQAGLNRVRLLAKHAPTRLLVRRGAGMLAYDIAYVTYMAVRQRTTAPLAGRLRGLREWRRYRALGSGRRPVALAPTQGIRAAVLRRSAWSANANRG